MSKPNINEMRNITEGKYLHIVVDTPDEYFVAVFTGFVDDVPTFKRVATTPRAFLDLKPAAECADKLNKLFPKFTAVTLKKGEA